MRIVSWNMGCFGSGATKDEAWRWLLDELKPDIALLQECVVPDWVREPYQALFSPALQRWGTAVVTRELPIKPYRPTEGRLKGPRRVAR